jgi:hypothetical protein
MAYDRYDTHRDRDWRGSDQQRGYNRDRDRGDSNYQRGGRNDDDRGFFERAGDEIASWFGDDDAERRRRQDEHMDRDRGNSWGRGRDYDRGYGRGYERDHDRDRYAYRSDRDRNRSQDDDRGSYRPMDWTSSDRDYRSGSNQDRGYSTNYAGGSYGRGGYGSGNPRSNTSGVGTDRDYQPMTGDYGRSQSPWGQDDYRRTSYAGSSRHNDRHYDAWRQRQMDELDRDYDDYHRERQQRFDKDFGSWREDRQQKRGKLSQIREHMDVVGSDGDTIGKVDCVKGDHIVLTKSDSPDNRHHSLSCSMIDTVEGDQVRLDIPAEEAKSRWDDADKRGFFGRGRDRDRDDDDMNLNRSFSGTYES